MSSLPGAPLQILVVEDEAPMQRFLRATLVANGYQVTVTELAGWEHSLKNELILGRRVQHENGIAKKRLEALLATTGVRPKIVQTLGL